MNSEALISRHTSVARPWLVPEIPLHLLTYECDGYSPDLSTTRLPWEMPYWAFAWPGGQVLARFLLENREVVQGKTVLNIGSGCAIESIAAAQMGARAVHSNDIDPVATIAGSMNAQLSNLTLEFSSADVIGTAVNADVILAGDVWYDRELADRMVPWLRKCARHSLVLVGDAGRVPLDNSRDDTLFEARAPFDGDIRGGTLWNCRVLKLAAD